LQVGILLRILYTLDAFGGNQLKKNRPLSIHEDTTGGSAWNQKHLHLSILHKLAVAVGLEYCCQQGIAALLSASSSNSERNPSHGWTQNMRQPPPALSNGQQSELFSHISSFFSHIRASDLYVCVCRAQFHSSSRPYPRRSKHCASEHREC